ncbi:MAG: isochorismatase family protein [Candidatus Nezhaarchaeales archaeon]
MRRYSNSLRSSTSFFVGIALNICVESTVRDAFFREFWPIVVSDCCEAIGPNCARRSSLWNISNMFGWITSSRSLIKNIKKLKVR